MTWKESLEEFRESLLYGEKQEGKREAKESPPEKDTHRIDKATGSEVLDD